MLRITTHKVFSKNPCLLQRSQLFWPDTDLYSLECCFWDHVLPSSRLKHTRRFDYVNDLRPTQFPALLRILRKSSLSLSFFTGFALNRHISCASFRIYFPLTSFSSSFISHIIHDYRVVWRARVISNQIEMSYWSSLLRCHLSSDDLIRSDDDKNNILPQRI